MIRLISPRQLRARHILGMNERNIGYIARYNDRRLYARVDNKLITKELAAREGINTPALHLAVTAHHQIGKLQQRLEALGSFVIKPAKGSGGKGILVITGSSAEGFATAFGKKALGFDEIKRHLANILAGLYSLGGAPDVAIIEEVISLSPVFAGYSHGGIPDIRIIVFHGYPVMAMLRLATSRSRGKANLHQGGVGVGIDLHSGRALRAICQGRPIRRHPDTGLDFNELAIPDWPQVLELAAACHELCELAYFGADIAIDADGKAMILELNARPGLAIQAANNAGLRDRLQRISALAGPRRSPAERVARVLAD